MTTHDLADRLTRLERENRRLKRIGAVVLIGIIAVVVMGQGKEDEPGNFGELRTRTLFVVDDAGKARMVLEGGSQEDAGHPEAARSPA